MMRLFSSGLRLAACCFLLLIMTGMVAGEPGKRNEAEFDRLKGYLGAMQNLRAEFNQQVMGPEDKIIEQASGSVVLSKPGRFRWDYRNPYERIIVADGERVWFYEADLEQVTIRRMAAGLGDTPAALLTGDAEALEQFELLDSWTIEGFDWLQLAPISTEADFSTVDIGFADGELQRIEFVDRLGQRTRLILSGIDRFPELADDEFLFEIPDGVDVIGEDDM
jgi:outer membrane lipoprotein carrier protein